MTESTPLWQIRRPVQLHLKKISKSMRIERVLSGGHFLCGVETVKCFVNIRLHCNVSNLKKIS